MMIAACGVQDLLRSLNVPEDPAFHGLAERLSLEASSITHEVTQLTAHRKQPFKPLSKHKSMGASQDEKTVLASTWRTFWKRRQQQPAWSKSSEMLQFSICIERSHIFSWSPSPFAPGQRAWKVGKPLPYMDGVRELMTVHHSKGARQGLAPRENSEARHQTAWCCWNLPQLSVTLSYSLRQEDVQRLLSGPAVRIIILTITIRLQASLS
ncbi:hypothetical protein WJX84_000722 [Apatococcus fuscideae]|uniref:Uncharacterized protein n=1 Tax=Apatococcus fuscideae TaxID=2026836 RepID=A0AAW1T0B3_9CHLO